MMDLRTSALLLAFSLPMMLAGQEAVCTPFDNNGDNIVGIGDLIDLLARFGDSDLDQDGIWDSADDCVGAYDTCGVCNGPGPQVVAIDTIVITFDSIYVDTIDEWLTYELSRDTLLHLVCENPGCTDPLADNYDPYAEEDGSCYYPGCFQPTMDGYTYDVVQIGPHCWMAENLRTTQFQNGDGLYQFNISSPPDSIGAWWTTYLFSYSPAHFGRMYNRSAILDNRGLCPVNWHVANEEEWSYLMDNFESADLIETTGWTLPNGGAANGNNSSGFSAKPGGAFDGIVGGSDGMIGLHNATIFHGYNNNFFLGYNIILPFSGFPLDGYYVRCVRD